MNEAANLSPIHEHLTSTIIKLTTLIDAGEASPKLVEVARDLAEAQLHLSDLSRSLRPFLARLP